MFVPITSLFIRNPTRRLSAGAETALNVLGLCGPYGKLEAAAGFEPANSG